MLRTIHRAKYILVEPDRLMQNASIHVSMSGRISRIEPWHSANHKREAIDWGSSIIIPGLVNAHTHLELTSLHNQLTQFKSFTDWISQLINRRSSWSRENYISSTAKGIQLSLASGVTLAGDISSSGTGWNPLCGEDFRRVIFKEVIAHSPDLTNQVLSQLNLLLKEIHPNPLLAHGISPHAPYSVSPELYRRSAELARNRGIPLATHVAETQAELQFLQSGTGEIRDFLDRMGVLPAHWTPPESTPIAYLDALGLLGPSCLLVHCNYLDEQSIIKILDTHSTVVYCPRSHDFFGHKDHPIRQLLDSGVNVALGTDSLASNSSLSMIDEMRFLYRNRKDVTPEEIFRAATASGAAALGYGGVLGRLRRGYWADMAVLELPQNLVPKDLLHQVLEGAGACIATVIKGKIVFKTASALSQ